jgi:glycerol-3-phosphate O-acyltransferase
VTSFDQIRDVEEYAAEQTGRAKPAESLGWLLRYVARRRRPLGRLRVDLGEPVVVARAPPPGDRHALETIAFEAARQANRVTPLTLTAVLCLVVLATAPRAVTAPELVKLVTVLADWARIRGIRLGDELAAGDPTAIFAHVDHLAGSGLLLRADEGSMVLYAIEPSLHPIASYYRNTIVHHFLHKAMIELALSAVSERPGGEHEETFWAEVDRLAELLAFEFYFPPRTQLRGELVAELQRVDPRWREQLSGDGAQVQRLARRLQPFIAHATLLPYVEAYSLVVEQLARLAPGERVDAQRCVQQALKEGRQAYLLRRVSSEASIGKILFENGLKLAAQRGLAGASTVEVCTARVALLQELRSLAQRMQRLRREALARAEEVMAAEAER